MKVEEEEDIPVAAAAHGISASPVHVLGARRRTAGND
jgi:hypothetical protein